MVVERGRLISLTTVIDILSRCSVPVHVVDVDVPPGQGVRVLPHGLLRPGNTVGHDFVGVVLDGTGRDARARGNRYVFTPAKTDFTTAKRLRAQ